jgi:hypothetical protein
MEYNVWIQLFVQAVNYLLNLLGSSKNQNTQNNGIASPNVPASVADSTSTSKNVASPAQELLKVIRNPQMTTADALFGDMVFDSQHIGATMERTAVAIPEGTYSAQKELSPHFGFETPHLTVPGRTYIEIHPANYPSQLEGCIAIGSTIDGDSLDNSDVAFQKMMALLPQEFIVVVS